MERLRYDLRWKASSQVFRLSNVFCLSSQKHFSLSKKASSSDLLKTMMESIRMEKKRDSMMLSAQPEDDENVQGDENDDILEKLCGQLDDLLHEAQIAVEMDADDDINYEEDGTESVLEDDLDDGFSLGGEQHEDDFADDGILLSVVDRYGQVCEDEDVRRSSSFYTVPPHNQASRYVQPIPRAVTDYPQILSPTNRLVSPAHHNNTASSQHHLHSSCRNRHIYLPNHTHHCPHRRHQQPTPLETLIALNQTLYKSLTSYLTTRIPPIRPALNWFHNTVARGYDYAVTLAYPNEGSDRMDDCGCCCACGDSNLMMVKGRKRSETI